MYFFPTLEDIPDQCSSSPCNDRGTVRCEDKKGDFLCHCFTGWTGARCEKGTVITSTVCHSSAEVTFLHIYSFSVMSSVSELLSLVWPWFSQPAHVLSKDRAFHHCLWTYTCQIMLCYVSIQYPAAAATIINDVWIVCYINMSCTYRN